MYILRIVLSYLSSQLLFILWIDGLKNQKIPWKLLEKVLYPKIPWKLLPAAVAQR